MTDPIVTTTRVSDAPVRWRTYFLATGKPAEGNYTVEVEGYGRTPELSRSAAAVNLERVKARMLVAEIDFEFGSRRVPETSGATES